MVSRLHPMAPRLLRHAVLLAVLLGSAGLAYAERQFTLLGP